MCLVLLLPKKCLCRDIVAAPLTSLAAKITHMELTMIILCAFILLASYGAGGVSSATTLGASDADMLSLLEFKRAITNDPTGALSSWNASVHFCRWSGVRCSRARPPRVVALDLAGRTLAGGVSPSLGNLTRLASLTLSTNKLAGPIPHLGGLRDLQLLDLSDNLLTGAIPESLTNCSSLRTLSLTRNQLVGEIPREIARLSRLSSLTISFNNLTGVIPLELGNMTSLRVIKLMHNELEGGIPDELGRLSNLTYLVIGQNRLSGEIPKAVYNLSSLLELALELNALVGTLPSNIGDTLPNLYYLTMAINMLEGNIPSSLGNASGMWLMDLSGNRFTGEIPESFGKLWNLSKLNLEDNMLEAYDERGWEFLHALGNCSALELFSVHGNMLHGALPGSVGNLSSSLNVLLFGNNNLSGLVPSSIGNLHNLTDLGLETNDFTGTIDGWIGKLVNLIGLFLNGNSFSEHIPSSIGNLTKLSILNLANNLFNGPIPSILGSLPQLSQVDLSYNNLQGNIPKEVLAAVTMVELVLSHNSLEGKVPGISNLQQLTKLELSSNQLIGEIPATLGTCQELGTIRMDQNLLSGSIPISLGNIRSLNILNLSHNNLTGTIPAALSNIVVLTELDLSHNHLEGEVPSSGVFKNVTAVSLSGNWGLCGGVLELHMPSCSAVHQDTGRLKILVKILIPIFGFVALLILLLCFILRRKKTFRMQLPLLSFDQKFSKVSYKDLAQATDNFAGYNLIGRGSYGSVYKGKLIQANMVVAVKVFDMNMQGADRSFMSECAALRSIRHRNLLPILTACSTIDNKGDEFRALVYEYMPNGNLDSWLHPTGGRNVPNQLDLTQRINIVVDIADALQYLHHDCESPIIHCDLKPSNILLDDDMTAHLADFGIARFYLKNLRPSVGDFSSVSSIGLKGTIGYIAPEYAEGSHISTSGDVYSFGVLLAETLTGKRPTDSLYSNGESIVNFIEKNFPDQILQVLDAQLREGWQEFAGENLEEERAVYSCLLNLLKVALSCTRQAPNERMNMRETAAELHAIKMSYLQNCTQSKCHICVGHKLCAKCAVYISRILIALIFFLTVVISKYTYFQTA
ncbi:hypothetical protein ACP70R_009932 [Stipagrostis hirtigluma subsp. patula]